MKCPHCNGTGTLENVTIGSCVLAARRKAGLTQIELSEKSGISRGQIANLETDRTDLSIKALMRVATALGVPAGDLLP
jgi:transcriptional regulator with XRE-family HTH domain